MEFISASRIGKEFCISYQKINKILAEQGLYDSITKQPTKFAIENGFAKICSTKSKFHGNIIEFNVWNFNKLKSLFPKELTEIQKAMHCTNREHVFDNLCFAFSEFGDILEISYSKPKKGISKEAFNAVIESYYCDPNYVRGTLLIHRFPRRDELESIKKTTMALAEELFEVAKKIDEERAKNSLRVIESMLTWLDIRVL